MKTTTNTAPTATNLEARADALWNATTDAKVKYELRFVFELAGLGFETEAAQHLAKAEELSRVRVKITRAQRDHIETAILGCEGYESVVLRTAYVEGTPEQLSGIATRLEDAADDAEMNIEMNSLREIPEHFLRMVAKRSEKVLRTAVKNINRAIG